MNYQSYQYWLIRYVPNIARGEFINVGIVAGRDGGDWSLRWATSQSRATRLGGSPREITKWVRWFERVFYGDHRPINSERSSKLTTEWLSQLSRRQANSVQVTAAVPIEAASSTDAINLLYPLLVEGSDDVRRRSGTRRKIAGELREIYEFDFNLEVGRDLLTSPIAKVGKQRTRFDLAAFTNGAPHLTHAWAFDTKNPDSLQQEIQSWSFLVGLIREDGASMNGFGRLLSIADDVPIHAVYEEPRENASDRMVEVFSAARDAWQLNDVRAITLDELLDSQDRSELIAV